MLLYNTLTKKKEIFKPLSDKKVRLYVCGITPYDTTHLGHAFLYIFFDVLVRYFKHKGYDVNYVQNVTDVDDDILKRAKEEKRDWNELGDFWTERFLNDYKLLNMVMPTHYVKATESMETIVEIIKKLLTEGIAYKKAGNIYFEIKKFKKYGELSKLSPKEMFALTKERGGNPEDTNKKNPLDFILWQKSEEGEPEWNSPWGKGRPGWHIECSAMNYKYLGAQIDIHGGGYDLIYPHHESEIAQAESFTRKSPFVRYWMHTAMVLCKGEKMSKSLGNMVFVSDLLKKYSSNSIRWVLLSHHYRKEWQFEAEKLDNASQIINELKLKLEERDAGDQSKLEGYFNDDMDIPKALQYIKSMSGNPLRSSLEILGFKLFS